MFLYCFLLIAYEWNDSLIHRKRYDDASIFVCGDLIWDTNKKESYRQKVLTKQRTLCFVICYLCLVNYLWGDDQWYLYPATLCSRASISYCIGVSVFCFEKIGDSLEEIYSTWFSWTSLAESISSNIWLIELLGTLLTNLDGVSSLIRIP